jgi:hypothetical protein
MLKHISSARNLVILWDLKKCCVDALIFVYDLFLLFCFYSFRLMRCKTKKYEHGGRSLKFSSSCLHVHI